MLTKLRDPIWQAIGVLVAIVTVIITVYLTFYIRETKSLSTTVLAVAPVVQVSSVVPSKLDILYDGKPVTNLMLFQIQFKNTGDKEIIESDYSQPIRIVFNDAELFDATISDSNPSNLGLIVIRNSNVVTLSKTLLNPNDSFVVNVLLISNKIIDNKIAVNFNIDARIAGIQEIFKTNIRDNENEFPLTMYNAMFGVITGLLVAIVVNFLVSTVSRYMSSYKNTKDKPTSTDTTP